MSKNDGTVQILLSTYNGERYLRQQLDSYVQQTCFSNVRVLIRDDGSTDGTAEILREYERQYGFQVLLGRNVGINASYRLLLQASDPDCRYYAFSDQDDVWLPDKLETAISRLDGAEADVPLLFFSLSRICDEQLRPGGTSLYPGRGASFFNAMVQNVCPGHTQVFNGRLREMLLRADSPDILVIDWWAYLTASGLGQVLFEPRCLVMHRQHGDNAWGYERGFFKNTLKRLRRVRSQEAAAMGRQLACFQTFYGPLLPEAYAGELSRFLGAQRSFWARAGYVFSAHIFRQTAPETALVRLLYLFGKYRLKDE